MLVTQIDHVPISDEEKFGYLLESVGSKELQTVNRELWDRLKKEFLANQGISELAQG